MIGHTVTLQIGVLYPERMYASGDRGNLLILTNRAGWRDIGLEISGVPLGERFDPDRFDLILFGGREDRRAQTLIADDLKKSKEKSLREAAERDVTMLITGGAYPLCGRYVETPDGQRVPGIGLFDVWTEAGAEEMTGEIILECDWLRPETLVGYERHAGKTYAGFSALPFGRRLLGHGNNGEDPFEGCRHRFVFGTYLQGSLLPYNPHFADLLIRLALRRRHGDVTLRPLDDALEWETHQRRLEPIGRRADYR
jgi:CobQ-like glutamine amidotransferase family enzyme